MNELTMIDDERMTSLQIAEVTGKPHYDVMKAIRKMEPAWSKINEGKFSLVKYKDQKRRVSSLLLPHQRGMSLHRHQIQR